MNLTEPLAWQADTGWLGGLGGPAWLVDGASLAITAANEEALAWFAALGNEPLIGRPASAALPNLQDQAFWLGAAAQPNEPLCSEVTLAHPSGGEGVALRRITRLATGQWLVTLQDITAQRQAEARSQDATTQLRATLEAVASGVLVCGLDGRIRAFNQRFAQMWSLPQTALHADKPEAIAEWMRLNVLDPLGYSERLARIEQQPLTASTDTLALVDGSLLERHSAPQWHQSRPIGRVYSFHPLNGNRVGAPRRRGASGFDPYTGLPGRTQFVSMAARCVDQARQGHAPLAVVCVEVDRRALFAMDGQAAARSLQELGLALGAQVREPQRLARLGAGRFAVVLHPAGEEAALALARRLVEGAARAEGAPVRGAGLAVGIAMFPQAGLDAPTLLAHAEAALDAALGAQGAKDAPSGEAIRVFDASAAGDAPEVALLCQLAHSGRLDERLTLRYHPRICARTQRWQAVQALLRWQGERGVSAAPAHWLAQAERAGLGTAIDDWLLGEALQQARRWLASGLDTVLTVSVGATQIVQPGFARRLRAALEAAQWPALGLEIDVTSEALLADREAALANAQSLHAWGVRLVLSGYGSAGTSIDVLRDFPLTAVKLDGRLLRTVPLHARETAIARALIELAQAMGLEVYAQGVETEAQRRFVSDAGCDAWQGFLAMPPQTPLALIDKFNDARAQALQAPGSAPSGPSGHLPRGNG